jgi:hypothetical protein
MDEKSKLKIMLFFNSLKEDMNYFNGADFKREGLRYAENGYFYAVDKMNDLIQGFIDKEIEDS